MSVSSLLVRLPGGEERILDLGPEPVTFGRDPSSTIRIESPYASRRHARVELRAGGAVLVDLGSRNGSLLNGGRIEGEAPVKPGDVLTIADVSIECLAEPATLELTRVLPEVGDTAMPAPAAAPAGGGPSDSLVVDAQTYEVMLGGKPPERRLSAQEFQLLSYLYEHRDRVCARQELGDVIWGKDNWDPNMLHRLVHRLKEKIEPQPDRPRYVQTVPWVGYRLTP